MANKKQNKSAGSSSRKSSSSSGRSGSSSNRNRNGGVLDDITYNVITVLHEKSKGLEAYEQYLEDAQENEEVAQIFEEIREQDQQAVQRLEECLRMLVGGGDIESEEDEAA